MPDLKYVSINCHGSMIEVYAFLRPLWPFELPLDRWPTFCGAGDGFGDWIVPDTFHGECVSPACLQHDLDWILCENSISGFLRSNFRLYRNLRSLALPKLSGITRLRAELDCVIYFAAVSTVGKKFFKADPDDRIVVEDPLDHPTVQSKLRRLATVACLGFNDPGEKK